MLHKTVLESQACNSLIQLYILCIFIAYAILYLLLLYYNYVVEVWFSFVFELICIQNEIILDYLNKSNIPGGIAVIPLIYILPKLKIISSLLFHTVVKHLSLFNL